MMTLNDGRSELWQWDTGRTLSVPDDCSQVHFSNKVFGRSVDVDVVDGKASIPDVLLQTDKELTAWAFIGTAENGYTKISKVFKVNKRNKPADYVFTPPDQTTLGEILDRIEDLENRPSGDVSEEDIQNAVNDYLDKNPISIEEKDPTVPDWAKQASKPTYTAQEVGALPSDTVIPEIPDLSGYIVAPREAEVGQTIVVKAVDENGKPTEWESADLNGLCHIKTITLTEEVTSITVDTDEDGNPFNVQKLIFKFTAIGGTGNENYACYHFYPNPINAGAIRCDVEDGVYPAGRTIGSTGEIQMLGTATYFTRFCPSNKYAKQQAGTHTGGKYTSIQSLTMYLATEGYTFGVGTKLEVYGVSV